METAPSEIEKQLTRGKSLKLTAGLVAFLISLGAGGVIFTAKFEPRSHADQVHAQEQEQIEGVVVDVKVLKALVVQIDRRFDRIELNVDHVQDAVHARKEPLVESAPASVQSTIGPGHGR